MGNNSRFYILLVLAVLAQSLSLLNHGIFWDDWVTFSVSYEGLLRTYYSAGSPLTAYVHEFIRSWGPMGYRVAVLSCIFITAGCFYFSLSRLRILKSEPVQILTLLFLAAPLNLAKWSAINCPSMIYTTFFFIGVYLFIVNMQDSKFFWRILSLFFLFASFSVLSILLFYYALFAVILASVQQLTIDKKTWRAVARRYPDFILLPVVFWILKKVFFVPYGNYLNYNVFSLASLLKAVADSYKLLWFSWLHPILVSVESGFFIGALFALFAWYALNKMRTTEHMARQQLKNILYSGLILFLVAGIPYLAVGKLPRIEDWHSRHQQLMPIGFALITFGGLEIAFKKYSKVALYFLLGCFIAYTTLNQLDYIRDSIKQEKLMSLFSQEKKLVDEKVFFIDDQAKNWNVFERDIRFYEFSGWFRKIYGDQTRYGVLKEFRSSVENLDPGFITDEYNLKDFRPVNRACDIVIKSASEPHFYQLLFDQETVKNQIFLDSIDCHPI